MADDHKLFVTPVSVSDGFKRADGRTWLVLSIALVFAIAVAVLLDFFVEKPKIQWPSSPTRATPPAAAQSSEDDGPRTYDVAPPGAVPPPPPQH